jgi:hypothetical protein
MALPSNPQTLATYDITQSDQAKIFVKKVSDLFLALSTASALSGILNGSGTVSAGALITQQSNLGSVSTNQTVNCVNALSVFVTFQYTAAITLNLTNVATGAIVYVRAQNSSGGALVLKFAGTNSSGAALIARAVSISQGAEADLVATGASLNAGVIQHFNGQCGLGTGLFFLTL